MTTSLAPDITSKIADAFKLALNVAQEQVGATAPNPAVGCVLLDAAGDTLIATAHLGAGQAHAEARAIKIARECGMVERIDKVIVTLEPCNHQGRTGPCTDAILATPARQVWYAQPDPNTMASGGALALRRAGLEVFALNRLEHPDQGRLLIEATRLLAPFATRVRLGRPFVTVKQAFDQYGSMIPQAGKKTFTGMPALTVAHQLRRRADAILTGSGTILADRPEFTVRHIADILGKSRFLCIFDRSGRVDEGYIAEARKRGFRPFVAHDIHSALQVLAEEGCNEVLVEAGPTLTEVFRNTGLWDEWVLIQKGSQGQTDSVTIRPKD